MTVTLAAPATANAPALRLRPWRAEDAPDLLASHQDPVFRRWSVKSPIEDEVGARRWIDKQTAGWAAGSRCSFAILEDTVHSRPVGGVVLKAGSDFSPTAAEVGYWTSAEVRGRGVASRGLEAVSQWALGSQTVLPLDHLELIHSIDNHASCRVAEKCEFALQTVLAAEPPTYPTQGHLHTRTHGATPQH